ncbi:hypothetical protein D3C72_2144560 [compost metagenome]
MELGMVNMPSLASMAANCPAGLPMASAPLNVVIELSVLRLPAEESSKKPVTVEPAPVRAVATGSPTSFQGCISGAL